MGEQGHRPFAGGIFRVGFAMKLFRAFEMGLAFRQDLAIGLEVLGIGMIVAMVIVAGVIVPMVIVTLVIVGVAIVLRCLVLAGLGRTPGAVTASAARALF